jgi:hypothetical protein
MEEIVYKALLNSFHKRLAYLAGKKIIKLADYAKAENQFYHCHQQMDVCVQMLNVGWKYE